MDVGAAFGAVMAPLNFTSASTRHALDVVTFGQVSDRYNARDKYRNDYSDAERAGAGFGAAAGTAIPAVALTKWVRAGREVPQALPNVPRAGRIAAVGVAAALGAGIVATGTNKLAQIVGDDGNLGAVGMSAGVLGGALGGMQIGQRLGGAGGTWKARAFGGLVGMVAGGVALGAASHRIQIGDSKIGVPHEQAPNVDHDAGDRAGSFAKGLWNHFIEFGPISQGQANAQSWGLRETFHDKYSNAERNGAMNGDLLGAAAMSAGAAGMVMAGMGVASKQVVTRSGQVLSPAASAADRAGRYTRVGAVNAAARHALQMVPGGGAGRAAGIAMATGAIGTALVAAREVNAWKDEHNGTGGGLAAVAVAGTTGGLAAALVRSKAFSSAPRWNRVGGAVVAASGIVGVLSSARIGISAFRNDAKDAQRIAPGDPTTRAVMGGTLGVLGSGAGLAASVKKMPAGGIDIGIPIIKKALHVPRTAGIGIATLGAGALGAMIGAGVSPTLPSIGSVGIAAGAGAAVAGVGVLGLRGLTRSGMTRVLRQHPDLAARGSGRAMATIINDPVKLAATGAAGGALAGAMSSGIWKADEPTSPAASSLHGRDVSGY